MIQDFQKRHHLTPDGIVGEDTARKIMGVFCDCNRAYAAHFLGQCAHESARFTRFEENLNYSYERLLEVFPYDVDSNDDGTMGKCEKEKARYLAGKPEEIANFVYAHQNGNGPEWSGDGWKYRGRGAIMLTGRANYLMFSKVMGNPKIMEQPDLILKKYVLDTAKVFFDQNEIWRHCGDLSEESIKRVTKTINGGYNGLQDRIDLTHYYNEILLR